MNYHKKIGKESYLFAETNLDIETVRLYLEDEQKQDFFKTEIFKKLEKESSPISVLCDLYVGVSERQNGFAKSLMFNYFKDVKSKYHLLVTNKTNDSKRFQIEEFYKEYGFEVVLEDREFSVMLKGLKKI
ncbi:MAG: hypothetical protein CL760_11960 [Chloroflexi bacterium]|nr:hypothetical protein [Chloroflexota bacterium]